MTRIPDGIDPALGALVPISNNQFRWRAPRPAYSFETSHASPFGKRFFLRPVLPNIVSTQQFPQEMEFTENVSTIPMKRLVFKKGGVLKAQNGMGGRPIKDGNFE